MNQKERVHELKLLISSLNTTRSRIDKQISILTKELTYIEKLTERICREKQGVK